MTCICTGSLASSPTRIFILMINSDYKRALKAWISATDILCLFSITIIRNRWLLSMQANYSFLAETVDILLLSYSQCWTTSSSNITNSGIDRPKTPQWMCCTFLLTGVILVHSEPNKNNSLYHSGWIWVGVIIIFASIKFSGSMMMFGIEEKLLVKCWKYWG